jgi:hypothetical protein
MIALIGSEGSMGKRYQAILKYLDQDYLPLDRAHYTQDEIMEKASSCAQIIIASPTPTHFEYMRTLLPLGADILCEKPVTKNLMELEELHSLCSRMNLKYKMVMQYRELIDPLASSNWTEYNYFRHGNDGIAWDCMQAIALAKGVAVAKEDSPVWYCMINGQELSIADMDQAYVDHVTKWLEGRLDQSMDEILNAHYKVANYIEAAKFPQEVPAYDAY